MARNKIQDGDMTFLNGMNSSLAPDQLTAGFYARSMNMVNRGGVLQTRPGYRCMFVTPDGFFQGGKLFKPKQGIPSILFGVAGNLYISDFPFRSFRKIDGVSFSPTARQLYFAQVEQSVRVNTDGSLSLITPRNLLIIQDGAQSAPVVFDGTSAEVQRGTGKIPLGGPMAWVGDRLWVARGALLFASDIANPLSFTEPLYLASPTSFVLPNTITALTRNPATAFPQLLCFTQTTTTVFQAGIRDRSQWASTPDFQKEIFPNVGCGSQRSVVSHYGFLWWYSNFGLTSIDAAAQTFVSSALPYKDGEMIDSKSRLSSDLNGVACSTFENYLLVSVPHADKFNSHTWCLDNSTIVSGKSSLPTWNSIWTGTRPVEWISDDINGIQRSLYFSADYDGKNRLWEAFTPDRLDDGCPISWYAELRGLHFDLPGKAKEFRYADVFMSELSGIVDIAIFWAGAARGKYKRILTKRIIASRGSLRSGEIVRATDKIFALKKQSRPLRTQDGRAIISEETLSSCDVESPALEFKDESFQLLIVGSGPAAIRGAITYAEPPTNIDDSGACEHDETEENFVRFDGAAAEADTFEQAHQQFVENLPVFTSVRSEVLSQDGFTEVGFGEAESVVSQQDADKIATAIARRKAAFQLEKILPKIVSIGAGANEL